MKPVLFTSQLYRSYFQELSTLKSQLNSQSLEITRLQAENHELLQRAEALVSRPGLASKGGKVKLTCALSHSLYYSLARVQRQRLKGAFFSSFFLYFLLLFCLFSFYYCMDSFI